MFKRLVYDTFLKRFTEKRRFIQVMAGPRQVGKTTLARQLMAGLKYPCQYASADEPALKNSIWLEQQWQASRSLIKTKTARGLLILDEIHKIPGWSETVKRLWDEDALSGKQLYVLLLGSFPLLIKQGLTESLAGRFEVVPVMHWSYGEMKAAFDFSLEKYIIFGGYPGSVPLIRDFSRWQNYILESIVETTISRDILLMTRVDKPALLRRLFELGCVYSARILSFQKMLGQLQDAGNTVTLAHYLKILEQAGLLAGLSKYAGSQVRQRASSPKFQVMNNALLTAQTGLLPEKTRKDPKLWGRMVENTVGSSLLNGIKGKNIELFYWAGYNHEVDFILSKNNQIIAIEVKSGIEKETLPGIALFSKEFKVTKNLLVGTGGIPLNEFLLTPVEDWFN